MMGSPKPEILNPVPPTRQDVGAGVDVDEHRGRGQPKGQGYGFAQQPRGARQRGGGYGCPARFVRQRKEDGEGRGGAVGVALRCGGTPVIVYEWLGLRLGRDKLGPAGEDAASVVELF